VTLVRNGPLNTACRTLIEESSGCEDDQAALQGAENRSCLAQVMRSGTVGLEGVFPETELPVNEFLGNWPLWLGTDVQDYSASVTTCNTLIGLWNPLYDQTLTLLSAAACV
jgi:hypothetical protein